MRRGELAHRASSLWAARRFRPASGLLDLPLPLGPGALDVSQHRADLVIAQNGFEPGHVAFITGHDRTDASLYDRNKLLIRVMPRVTSCVMWRSRHPTRRQGLLPICLALQRCAMTGSTIFCVSGPAAGNTAALPCHRPAQRKQRCRSCREHGCHEASAQRVGRLNKNFRRAAMPRINKRIRRIPKRPMPPIIQPIPSIMFTAAPIRTACRNPSTFDPGPRWPRSRCCQ